MSANEGLNEGGPEIETRGEEMRARCKKSSKCQCQLIIAQIQYNIECEINRVGVRYRLLVEEMGYFWSRAKVTHYRDLTIVKRSFLG